MNKIFNIISSFKTVEAKGDGVTVSGMASTTDIDRVGDVIAQEAWTKGGLKNFKQNPIILFNHNYDKPIGRATELAVSDKGLGLEAYVSTAAADNVCALIKDGVLGAFSVGFIVKDAEYVSETDIFKIKDAELLEVSVVSVPCNQTATFSVAKSFDSEEEYKDFKETFTNRVDLAGQSLAKEVTASSSASDASEGARERAQMEIKMSGENTPKVDLEALATKAAEQAAAKLAMKQAEKDAAEAADKKAKEAADAALKVAVEAGVSGTEKLIEDMQAKFEEKDVDFQKALAEVRDELKEKTDEMTKMRESKRLFVDRGPEGDLIKANGKELMYAHMLGVYTRKGWDTDYAKEVFEKAGIDYTTNTTTGDLDQEVQDRIQKEITVYTKVAGLFREIPVNGRATVLPVQTDTGFAAWTGAAAPSGNLENRGDSDNTYKAGSVTMLASRLISSTYMDNDIDEQTLVNLMPMLTDGVARAHARSVEEAILVAAGGPYSNMTDLTNAAATAANTVTLAGSAVAADLLAARAGMGKYGLNPEDLAYVVNQDIYYDLIQDPEFANLNEVGDMATKIKGIVGAIYGSPVVVSDEFVAPAVAGIGAFIVHRPTYVIPRLRGITVEQDYEVMNQRRVIVASQSLGFTELFAGDGAGNEPSVALTYAT